MNSILGALGLRPVTSLQKRAMDSESEQSNVTFKIEDLLTRASHTGANPQRSLPWAAKRSKQFATGGPTGQNARTLIYRPTLTECVPDPENWPSAAVKR